MSSSRFGAVAVCVALSSLAPAVAPAQAPFLRGDTDGNGSRDIGDAVSILVDRYTGLRLITCDDAADVNDDGRVDIADPVYLLRYLFLANPPPPPPFLECSDDPTADDLGCVSIRVPCFPCAAECLAPAACIPTSTGETLCTANLMTCDEIRAAYDFVVAQLTSGCDGATGCRLEPGHCTIGLGHCYYFASNRLPPELLPALASRFQQLGCVDPETVPCECPHPPEGLECVEGDCAPAF